MTVKGTVFTATGNGSATKTSKTSLAAHLTQEASSSIDPAVTITVGLAEGGDFEVQLVMEGRYMGKSLAKGNLRRLAREIKKAQDREKGGGS